MHWQAFHSHFCYISSLANPTQDRHLELRPILVSQNGSSHLADFRGKTFFCVIWNSFLSIFEHYPKNTVCLDELKG